VVLIVKEEGAALGVNVMRPIAANGILCIRGVDALFPDDFEEDLLTFLYCVTLLIKHPLRPLVTMEIRDNSVLTGPSRAAAGPGVT